MKPLHLETPFAQYQSHRLIGQGGAGKVYEARSNGVDEDVVAIKVLDPATATRERLSRFKNEILFGVRAKHSGIVPVLDSGLALVDGANVPFYVMPLYPATLRDVLKREANGTRLLALFVSLLDGVEAAHLLGVVHRDLKPENIFLSTNEERLVVGGFGIARFTAEALYTAVETRPGARLANFQYAAPEQRARGKTIDQRADLYALGLILNELFTHEIAQGTSFKTIAAVAPALGYLDPVVEELLRQDAADRIPTIEHIKQRLIAEGHVFAAQQRLDELSRTVVPKHSSSAPEIATPVALMAADVQGNTLVLKLNRVPSGEWLAYYRNNTNVAHVMGFNPRDIDVRGDTVRIGAPPALFQRIIDDMKAALAQAATGFPRFLEEKAELAQAQERHRLQEAARAEQERVRLLKGLRL